MIRINLPEYLKQYYGELENVDCSNIADLLQIKNFFFFKLYLYRLPDMYKVNDKDSPIYVYYFSVGKKRPTVQVTDILGGTMKWDEKKKKANTNYPIAFINAIICILFKRWNVYVVCTDNKGIFNDGDTPENFQLALKNVVYNNLQALKFIKAFPTTDIDHIYAIGVSLGALTMAGVYGIEDSYKKAVLILCGHPLSTIISESDEGMVRNFWTRIMKLYNGNSMWTWNELQKALKNSEDVFKYIPENTILQVRVDKEDTSIPNCTQLWFNNWVKPKETIIIKYRKWLGRIHKIFKNGHYQTLLSYPFLMYRTIKFLSKE